MLGVEGIKKAILKAIEQGMIGYVPSMIISSGTPIVENPSLISFEKVIPVDELDLDRDVQWGTSLGRLPKKVVILREL